MEACHLTPLGQTNILWDYAGTDVPDGGTTLSSIKFQGDELIMETESM